MKTIVAALLLALGASSALAADVKPVFHHHGEDCPYEPSYPATMDGFRVVQEVVDQSPAERSQIEKGLFAPILAALSKPPSWKHWSYAVFDLGHQGQTVVIRANVEGMTPPFMTPEEPRKVECGENATFLLVDQGEGFVLVWSGWSYYAAVRPIRAENGQTVFDLAFARDAGYSRFVYDHAAEAYRLRWIPTKIEGK